MARLGLNKAALQRETRRLDTFKRFLPSLDLKRQQLLAERAKAQAALKQTDADLARLRRNLAESLPMSGDRSLVLDRLCTLDGADIGEENLVGTRLPVLRQVYVSRRPYAILESPHWLDRLSQDVQEAIRLNVRKHVQKKRLALLNAAVRKVTQRVNLFDKVLIPRSRNAIERIKITLSDQERAAVVRAKLAKRKRTDMVRRTMESAP